MLSVAQTPNLSHCVSPLGLGRLLEGNGVAAHHDLDGIRRVMRGARLLRRVMLGARLLRRVMVGARLLRRVMLGARLVRRVMLGARLLRRAGTQPTPTDDHSQPLLKEHV
eukprot:8175452-Alexandrium_andersonii.AAC.1